MELVLKNGAVRKDSPVFNGQLEILLANCALILANPEHILANPAHILANLFITPYIPQTNHHQFVPLLHQQNRPLVTVVVSLCPPLIRGC